MFLLATFFTTAGNSSDAFFPLAISWKQIKTFNPPTSSLLFNSREKTHTHNAVSNLKRMHVNCHDALTPTTLFMASSLSDSLLLSNISLRSSFLRTENTVTHPIGSALEKRHNKHCWGDSTNQFQELELDQRYCERSLYTTSVSASQITGYTCKGNTGSYRPNSLYTVWSIGAKVRKHPTLSYLSPKSLPRQQQHYAAHMMWQCSFLD